MGLIIVARLYADLKMFCYLERMVNKKHLFSNSASSEFLCTLPILPVDCPVLF